jgi:hypothetical protein
VPTPPELARASGWRANSVPRRAGDWPLHLTLVCARRVNRRSKRLGLVIAATTLWAGQQAQGQGGAVSPSGLTGQSRGACVRSPVSAQQPRPLATTTSASQPDPKQTRQLGGAPVGRHSICLVLVRTGVRQDFIKARRSGLRTSACVVSMPCG